METHVVVVVTCDTLKSTGYVCFINVCFKINNFTIKAFLSKYKNLLLNINNIC